ncbi:MAG: hypothetical protein KME29_04735 [Calothrix sp. FI2-JRJ7]|jgi:prophage antirepressor-like protein|nr:hypothetical protein [Calothrix sp. FI2-JRJ7]
MSSLTIFNFESHEVRFVGTAENPWWVAVDICAVLEIKNNRDAIARLDNDEKDDVAITDTIGRQQTVTCINESGLYSLVLTSRKSQAKRFKKWITSEVIPAIRKTGKYEAPQSQSQPKALAPSLEQISDLVDLTLGKAGIDPKLLAGVKLNAIAKEYPALAQAAEEAKSVLVVPIENQLLPPKRIGEIIGERTGEKKWSAQQVNKKLIEKELQIANPEGDNPDYLPTEEGKQYGEITLGTAKGHGKTVQHLRWYESVIDCLLEVDNNA